MAITTQCQPLFSNHAKLSRIAAIQGDGFRNLNEGDRVEFTIESSPKGPQAADVMRL